MRRLAHPALTARWRTLRNAAFARAVPHEETPTPELARSGLSRGSTVVTAAVTWISPRRRSRRGCMALPEASTSCISTRGLSVFTVRECMRIQDLPDELTIETTRTAAKDRSGTRCRRLLGRCSAGPSLRRSASGVRCETSARRRRHAQTQSGSVITPRRQVCRSPRVRQPDLDVERVCEGNKRLRNAPLPGMRFLF